MTRRQNQLYYFCAIPQTMDIPDGFTSKCIKAHQYMVVEHVGPMHQIYQTYQKIYTQLLPQSQYQPVNSEFIHFEKYDHRFHWNSDHSVIEIWIPVTIK